MSNAQRLAVLVGTVVLVLHVSCLEPSQPQPGSEVQNLKAGLAEWRKLKQGMATEEVKQLLGEPDTIVLTPDSEVWNYGIQYVHFGKNKQVLTWMASGTPTGEPGG